MKNLPEPLNEDASGIGTFTVNLDLDQTDLITCLLLDQLVKIESAEGELNPLMNSYADLLVQAKSGNVIDSRFLEELETKPNSKLISDFDNKLKRYTDAGKKTDMTIRDIQKKIKDLDKRTSTKHQQIIQDLQTQVNDPRRKIDRIERSSRSRSNISIKKTSSKKNKDKSKKNAKKKTRRR